MGGCESENHDCVKFSTDSLAFTVLGLGYVVMRGSFRPRLIEHGRAK